MNSTMTKSYTHEELMQVVVLHGMWLHNEKGGICANLQGANLQGANLQGANLQGADLHDANLHDANLWYANLQGANLRCANLQGANLQGANLHDANLWYANLQGAKHGTRPIFRVPIFITGARYTVCELWTGIKIGCESNVTSKNLPEMFDKHKTPDAMRPLYVAAVAMIESYATECPLLGDAQ